MDATTLNTIVGIIGAIIGIVGIVVSIIGFTNVKSAINSINVNTKQEADNIFNIFGADADERLLKGKKNKNPQSTTITFDSLALEDVPGTENTKDYTAERKTEQPKTK